MSERGGLVYQMLDRILANNSPQRLVSPFLLTQNSMNW
jgi:hypothetical protein